MIVWTMWTTSSRQNKGKGADDYNFYTEPIIMRKASWDPITSYDNCWRDDDWLIYFMVSFIFWTVVLSNFCKPAKAF